MKTARYGWLAGVGVVVLVLLTWNGCGGGSQSSSPPPPPPPPPPKFHGSAYAVGAIAAPTTTQPEAEEVISVDPNNRMNLVALITDFSLRSPALGTTKYSVSANGGSSWTESFVPLSGTTPMTSDGVLWADDRDPSVAIDKLGNVFLSGIYAQPPQAGQHSASGVYVCVGVLPNVALTPTSCNPVFTNTMTNDPFGEDKDSLAVDNSSASSSGNVYEAWIHFTGCSASGCMNKYIAFSRSTDHGATWSIPNLLTSGMTDVQWPQMTVGGDGTVYVSYEVFLGNGQAQHMLETSSDGGQTFSAQTITPAYTDVTFSTTYRKNSGPNLVVSPVGGAEYVYDVYAVANGTGSDIVVTRSLQPKGAGGFTAPVSVNDSTQGERIFPATAVDGNGVLHMSWFDTRNSSGTAMYDIYATYSKDQGATFAPNARVTPSSVSAGSFIGDYAGMAVEPGTGVAHAVWTSGGSNAGMLQTATLTAP